MTPDQALALFRTSVLKQQKWRVISRFLGETRGLRCLDLGADNGIISYLLRRQGGSWASADLEAGTVESIRSLVGSDVHQIDGRTTPFARETFDRVVIVDLLEHLRADRAFLEELFRIMRPGGELLINVPHLKSSLLRRVRHGIGQTDARHGHVRPGYSLEGLRGLLGDRFTVTASQTYSKFFTEAVDTLITWGAGLAKRGGPASRKGTVVTGSDLTAHQRLFRLYRLIYPLVWLVSRLDALLFWRSGYMLIVKASSVKPAASSQPGPAPAEPVAELAH